MKTSTTISLHVDLLEGARAVARSERRSFSAQIETWIEEKLTSNAEAQVTFHDCAETPHHLVPDPNADIAKRAVVKVPDKTLTKGGGR